MMRMFCVPIPAMRKQRLGPAALFLVDVEPKAGPGVIAADGCPGLHDGHAQFRAQLRKAQRDEAVGKASASKDKIEVRCHTWRVSRATPPGEVAVCRCDCAGRHLHPALHDHGLVGHHGRAGWRQGP